MTDTTAFEANFDGLVGPTHNYAGLSFGNVASQNNRSAPSNPRLAARQGLIKMKALHDRGFKQGVIPPHERPHIPTLRALGFSGRDADILRNALREAPETLLGVSSASNMWVANAATVSPSADTADGKVHFTPANLIDKFHRSIEHPVTGRLLRALFPDPARFVHHPALPAHAGFGDEGAANHTRLCARYEAPGVEFFVYGKSAARAPGPASAPESTPLPTPLPPPLPTRYPARQTLEASQAVARMHGLHADRVVFAQQSPAAIDAGVFHNDVIAVGNLQLLFCHQDAFLDQPAVLEQLRKTLDRAGAGLEVIEVPRARVSVQDAVASYLFNSQLLAKPGGKMALVIPEECHRNERVWAELQDIVARGSAIDELVVFDLKQSMQNGGGPACLRLRVALTEAEWAHVNPRVVMSDTLFAALNDWVDRHYRDRLAFEDLADPALLNESRTALDELTRLLGLGAVYDFQRG